MICISVRPRSTIKLFIILHVVRPRARNDSRLCRPIYRRWVHWCERPNDPSTIFHINAVLLNKTDGRECNVYFEMITWHRARLRILTSITRCDDVKSLWQLADCIYGRLKSTVNLFVLLIIILYYWFKHVFTHIWCCEMQEYYTNIYCI